MGIIRLRLLPCLIVLIIPSVNLAVIAGFQQQSKGSAHQGYKKKSSTEMQDTCAKPDELFNQN